MISNVAGVCIAVVVGLIIIRQWQAYTWGKCRCKRSMKGKTVIITGSNSGIGKATARELAKREARVILACRDCAKAAATVDEIRRMTTKGELVVKHLNLASLQSVRRFVDDLIQSEARIDCLINNAGIFQCPYMLTEDGFEMQLAVNYLGHFLLTVLLLDLLKSSSPSRIIFVTSTLYKKGHINFEDLNGVKDYNKRAAYSNSKLAGMLFAQELHRSLSGTGVCVYTVSPGHVWTNLGRHIKVHWMKMLLLLPVVCLFVRTPTQGSQTVIHCAISEELDNESGKFYRNCLEAPIDDVAKDEEVGKRLWEISKVMTGLKEAKE